MPQGRSIRARLLIVEVALGEVDRGMLSECQRAGEDGHLTRSMGAFLSWIAGRYDELKATSPHAVSVKFAAKGAVARFMPPPEGTCGLAERI